MDPLTQALMTRQQETPGFPEFPQFPQNPAEASSVPVTPPNPSSRIPPKMQRFNNAQAIQDAYRGGWTPNPVLLQATLAGKGG